MIDVLIVGAGHNGLVCACYLAAKGLSVRIVERRDVIGGAAVTEEFHPGFRNSTASYAVSLLHPSVIDDLHLAKHGLRIVERPLSNFVPQADGRALRLGFASGGIAATCADIAAHSPRDAAAYPAYVARLELIAGVLRELALRTPPNAGSGIAEVFKLWSSSRSFAVLSLDEQRDALDLFTLSAADWLDRWFESDAVKAALAFDSIVGSFASPHTSGTAYQLLHHVFGEVNGRHGAWGHAIGGMGAISDAIAAEARARGVIIDTSMPVSRIRVGNEADGRANGVVLDNGDEIDARIVVANVDPRRLFLSLIDEPTRARHGLDRYRHYQCESATLRINLALSELPDFLAAPGTHTQPHHGSGIIIGPSLDYLDRAHADARVGGWSREPIVELVIPSTIDSTLSPAGAHVASLFCQHFRFELPDGRHWDEEVERGAATDAAIDAVTQFAPNFGRSIIARQVHTPLDLERKFGLSRGDIFHGRLTLNQLFSARPSLGDAAYRMPIPRLYLCGAGAHPGGGVSGVPGRNAAREILRDRQSWMR